MEAELAITLWHQDAIGRLTDPVTSSCRFGRHHGPAWCEAASVVEGFVRGRFPERTLKRKSSDGDGRENRIGRTGLTKPSFVLAAVFEPIPSSLSETRTCMRVRCEKASETSVGCV